MKGKFIFTPGDNLNTSQTMSLLKRQDLQAFFKRLQKDLDRRKKSNEKRLQSKIVEQSQKLQDECTFKPERPKSKLAFNVEKSMLEKYESPIIRSAREKERLQQKLEHEKSIIGAETEADESYLFKMGKNSKKILARKEKKEKKGLGSSVRKSRRDSNIELPEAKPVLSNKKTEMILVQRFNAEWDHVMKESSLQREKKLNFDQFLGVLIGFRMIK